MNESDQLATTKEEFVTQWGALGSAWGINKTMGQIHALLMVSPEPMTTDQVMEELQISRGNAHSNLKGLVDWGLVRPVSRKGERKDLYEAEKDVWRIICTISRERRRRELEPAVQLLSKCVNSTTNLKSPHAIAFHRQVAQLLKYAGMANAFARRIADSEEKRIMPWLTRFLK